MKHLLVAVAAVAVLAGAQPVSAGPLHWTVKHAAHHVKKAVKKAAHGVHKVEKTIAKAAAKL